MHERDIASKKVIDRQPAGVLGERQPEKLAQLVVREVLVVLAVLHRRAVHEDARLQRSSCMRRLATREPPGLQVLVVGDSGVLGLELIDVLREDKAERPEALDQPLEVLLAQRRQLARRSRRSGDGLLLLLGRRLLDDSALGAPRAAVAPAWGRTARSCPCRAPSS